MSGICGVFSPQNPSLASAEILERMLGSLRHRGAEAERSHLDPAAGAALGHVFRAEFLDKAEEPLPLWCENESHNLIATLNGSVYETPRDHAPDVEHQSAAVAQAYLDDPEDFTSRIRGFFSLAVWDGQRRQMNLAADSLGSVPLYYYAHGQLLVFASELGALTQHPAVPEKFDPLSLQTYLARGAIFAPYSIYEDCHELMPGEVLSLSAAEGSSTRTYRLQSGEPAKTGSIQDLGPDLVNQLQQSLPRLTGSASRVGVFLSGGVDSGVALAILQESTSQCSAYTLRYTGQHNLTDATGAAGVAASTNSPLRTVNVSGADVSDALLSKLFQNFDEPSDVSRGITEYFLAAAARADGIDSCLTGVIGENIYGGMAWSGFPEARRETGSDQEAVDRMLSDAKIFDFDAQRRLLAGISPDEATVRERIVRPYAALLSIDDPYEHYSAALMLRVPTGRHGFYSHLVSSASNVSTRPAFREQDLINFGRSLPLELKEGTTESENRALVRATFAERLPHLSSHANKAAFPALAWTRPEFAHVERHILASLERLKQSTFFDPEQIDRHRLRYLERGKRPNDATRLWVLFCLQTWLDMHVNHIDPFA